MKLIFFLWSNWGISNLKWVLLLVELFHMALLLLSKLQPFVIKIVWTMSLCFFLIFFCFASVLLNLAVWRFIQCWFLPFQFICLFDLHLFCFLHFLFYLPSFIQALALLFLIWCRYFLRVLMDLVFFSANANLLFQVAIFVLFILTNLIIVYNSCIIVLVILFDFVRSFFHWSLMNIFPSGLHLSFYPP